MRPFSFADRPASDGKSKYLAGGTTLVDLMKLDVERPEQLIDINDGERALRRIASDEKELRLGALVRMSEAADNDTIRKNYPVIAQSLMLAASAQIRNMASLGGNVLQRTRCPYFRDVSYAECNKRDPGSGCAAREGQNRLHAVLGTSDQCVASYPGDFAQALIALDAKVETDRRTFDFADLHTDADKPEQENILKRGELIRALIVPAGNFRRSLYRKIRDRESYQFAVTSAAVVLDLDGERVRTARIALGGVAYKPWRATKAEEMLEGQQLTEEIALKAGAAAFAGAKPLEHNGFKVKLGQETIARALLDAKALEI
jgi:xanthine dehydrogenase YagS FAD-binding subunit